LQLTARVAVALALIGIAATAGPRGNAQPGGCAAMGLYVSTSGDDRHDGCSPAKSLRTVSEAMVRARPGVTVYLGQGTYYEQLVTRRAGARGAEIIIKSFAGRAVIDGSKLPWSAGRNQNQGLVELRHPSVRLVGVTVSNSKNTGILLAADDLTVEDSRISNTRLHGVSTHTDRQTSYRGKAGTMIRRIVLRGNLVERAALSGNSQAISLIADGFLVTGNTVRDSRREGIDIWLGARRGEVVGNTVHSNNAVGIYVDGAAYVKIHRNVAYRNRSGIGISSEDTNYRTHDIWVFNNVLYDNRLAGIFVWDDTGSPGYKGVQDLVVAHNTLIGNRNALYLSGEKNTATFLNNLGYSTGADVNQRVARSSLVLQGNVWLNNATGFVSPEQKDYRLTAESPAIDKGVVIPARRIDKDAPFNINADFAGRSRIAGGKPDAGAFEYAPPFSRGARSGGNRNPVPRRSAP
jgi:parallel beta-helix repeat protein